MPLTIPANDHGKLYIFSVPEDGAPIRPNAAQLAAVLGLRSINGNFASLIRQSDLGEYSLSDFIRDGYEMELTEDETATLDDLGPVNLVVMSRAFGGQGAQISPAPGVYHALTAVEAPEARVLDPLRSEAAQGTLEDEEDDGGAFEKTPSRVYLYALILFFGIFALMAWRIASNNV